MPLVYRLSCSVLANFDSKYDVAVTTLIHYCQHIFSIELKASTKTKKNDGAEELALIVTRNVRDETSPIMVVLAL